MKDYILIPILFLIAYGAGGQTANHGMLYVSPETLLSTVAPLENGNTGKIYNDGQFYVYSHFDNLGEYDFYQPSGNTLFWGMETQQLSGTSPIYLNNVSFQNNSGDSPFHLSGNVYIEGHADFLNGIVDNRNYGGHFIFQPNATHSNTSHDSHVDGEVAKVGQEDFVFPIGDATYYRFAGISSPTQSQTQYKATYFRENSNDIHPHSQRAGVIAEIDNAEYWQIVPQNNPEQLFITLSYAEETTPQPLIQAASREELTIVRWDETEKLWINEGGAIDQANSTITTMSSGYGLFSLARIKSGKVLPCGVTVYTAMTPDGDGNNDFFRIDKNTDCSDPLAVSIYNRWGVKVFETNNYGPQGEVFNGYSNGRLTYNNSSQLPTGTYYYILEFNYPDEGQQNHFQKAGFFYLSGN